MFEQELKGLRYLLENPGFGIFAVGFVLAKYYIMGNLFKRDLEKRKKIPQPGWRAPAQRSTRRHEIGIGTQDVLIMRRPRQFQRQLLFAVPTFLGGLALFYWFDIRSISDMSINAFVFFLLLCAAVPHSIWMFFEYFRRIHVSQDDIVLRRLFRHPQKFMLTEISRVKEFKGKANLGIILFFSDGRRLKLTPEYAGYADVLRSISRSHYDLQPYLMLGMMMDVRSRQN